MTAMITLPIFEFEEERMALMAEKHDILVELVDHMHRHFPCWMEPQVHRANVQSLGH